jgi:hypothetical protein
MTWPNDIKSSTPAKYQFKLISDTETIICTTEPIEWKSGVLEMKRDLESGGIFSTFQADSLTFVGNGAELLRKLFEAYEVNAKCTLVISWWKEFDLVTPTNGRQYVDFPSRFDINFNFYEKVKVGRFYFGIRVKAINSSTQTKLDNRQDVEVNLIGRTTIGGIEVQGYGGDDWSLKKKLHYTATSVNYNALFKKAWIDDTHWTGEFDISHVAHKVTFTSVPMDIVNNDIPETIQAVEYRTNLYHLQNVTPFLKAALYEHTFDITPNIIIWVTKQYHPLIGGSQPYELQLVEMLPNGTANNTYTLGEFGRDVGGYQYDDPITGVTVSPGNSLKLVVQSAGIDASYHAVIVGVKFDIKESVVNSPAATTEGFPLYEAIERTCQHILDTQYPIYSEFFGRTDVLFNETESYSSQSQLRYAHIQSGLNQRGANLDNPDVQIPVSFKNIFKSLKAIWNIGYSLETLAGETNQRIRIEEYAHFFEAAENVFTPAIKDRITKYDIQSQVMPELIPVDLKSGFDNFEYLTINGLGEPNTANQRTSIMNTASKWENISPIRGDTKAILDNLANPLGTEGSKDTKADNSIFIVKTQRATAPVNGESWIPEKATNITVTEGTSLFREELLNRYFTPTRMLRRHGNRIAAGMTLYPASVLKFQKSDKSSMLKTTGEGYTTAENADVLVSDLGAPIYKAIKHTAVIPNWTFADTQALQAYPFRYIKFSDTVSGYLLSFKKKNNEDKAEITIIEKYTP